MTGPYQDENVQLLSALTVSLFVVLGLWRLYKGVLAVDLLVADIRVVLTDCSDL